MQVASPTYQTWSSHVTRPEHRKMGASERPWRRMRSFRAGEGVRSAKTERGARKTGACGSCMRSLTRTAPQDTKLLVKQHGASRQMTATKAPSNAQNKPQTRMLQEAPYGKESQRWKQITVAGMNPVYTVQQSGAFASWCYVDMKWPGAAALSFFPSRLEDSISCGRICIVAHLWHVVLDNINKVHCQDAGEHAKHAHIHEFSHELARLCRGPSAAWPFHPAPGWASLSSNSTPQPRCFLLCSPDPISWHCTHTTLSTNCLSISPVPANYQLLMNGSPYWAERQRGEGEEERAGLGVRTGGEESSAECHYPNQPIQWWRVQTCSPNTKYPTVLSSRHQIYNINIVK